MTANIFVLAGVNGAGKSSLGGAALAARGSRYFNPDLAARDLVEADPQLTLERANGHAWEMGRRGLERALREGGPPPVDPADAVAVLEVIDAARCSAAERQIIAM